ncbi:hypothetical protein MRX96_051103 [Rhipicephalus microplus]
MSKRFEFEIFYASSPGKWRAPGVARHRARVASVCLHVVRAQLPWSRRSWCRAEAGPARKAGFKGGGGKGCNHSEKHEQIALGNGKERFYQRTNDFVVLRCGDNPSRGIVGRRSGEDLGADAVCLFSCLPVYRSSTATTGFLSFALASLPMIEITVASVTMVPEEDTL